MPNVVGSFFKRDVLPISGCHVLKQAELNPLRSFGVDRKVCSRTIPCGSLRIGPAGQYRPLHCYPPVTKCSTIPPARRHAAVFTQQRSTSPTLHACATHPRGAKGGSASKTSLMEPRHASPNWPIAPVRNERASVLFSGWSFSQASTKGPSSHVQTVP